MPRSPIRRRWRSTSTKPHVEQVSRRCLAAPYYCWRCSPCSGPVSRRRLPRHRSASIIARFTMPGPIPFMCLRFDRLDRYRSAHPMVRPMPGNWRRLDSCRGHRTPGAQCARRKEKSMRRAPTRCATAVAVRPPPASSSPVAVALPRHPHQVAHAALAHRALNRPKSRFDAIFNRTPLEHAWSIEPVVCAARAGSRTGSRCPAFRWTRHRARNRWSRARRSVGRSFVPNGSQAAA